MSHTIGILSDTHLLWPDEGLIRLLEGPFKGVDSLIHLGDFVGKEVFDLLNTRPLVAVRGNRDSEDLRRLLPEKELLELQGHRIGLIHGSGPFWGLWKRARGLFGKVDAILFGHTHRPFLKSINGILFMNPGAFKRDPLGAFRKRYGILKISDALTGTLCYL